MTKAVDLRLKEIKLAQRIAAENQNADPQAKDKRRVRSKVSKVRESKIDKEREKSTQKEKKKIRDDAAHLLEIEKKYFEAVQQVMKSNRENIPIPPSRFCNFDIRISISLSLSLSLKKKVTNVTNC